LIILSAEKILCGFQTELMKQHTGQKCVLWNFALQDFRYLLIKLNGLKRNQFTSCFVLARIPVHIQHIEKFQRGVFN